MAHRRTALAELAPMVVVALCGVAEAQPGAAPAAPETLLHLSATGSVQASPDELVADLVAQASSPTAAAAQRRVNSLIADGMKAVQSASGIDARAIGYSVSPSDEKRTSWVAQQTLRLRGSDSTILLELVGRLQEHGFAAASLDWQLSPVHRRRAHDEATTNALKELQARAASAAATLGLQVDHLRDVRLGAPEFPRRPTPMMAARATSAPQATAAPEDVTSEVSADVVLRP